MSTLKKGRPVVAALALLLAAALLSPPGTAYAIESISSESWHYPPLIPPEPETTLLGVSFDAKITPLDVLYGLRFTIVVRDSRGLWQPLIDWFFARVVDLPPAGSTARFDITMPVDCNPKSGRISAGMNEGWLTYVRPGSGPVRVPLTGGIPKPAAVTGRFGLAVRDENQVSGRHPMRQDAIACTEEKLATTVGIYFDPLGTSCQGTIRPGVAGKVYVLAKLDPVEVAGIAGAEFRFTGVPESWETYPVPDPALLAIGNPFGDGVSMGFLCQNPPSGVVRLYEVVVLAAAAESELEFRIEPRNAPGEFDCPFLLACDDPVFTKFCVESRPCFVNSSAERACAGPVAVTPTTWSRVKSMFR